MNLEAELPQSEGAKQMLERAFWWGYVYAVLTGARLQTCDD